MQRIDRLWLCSAALLVTGRAGVASLGRGIQSRTAFKHSIKRVDRFLGNDNVVVCDWCKALFATVLGSRKSVKIAIDWTKIGPWPVLVASVVIRRRGFRRVSLVKTSKTSGFTSSSEAAPTYMS